MFLFNIRLAIILGLLFSTSPAGAGNVAKPALGRQYWPGGIIPFTIEGGFRDAFRITQAAYQIRMRTGIQWIPRTNEVNYVAFLPGASLAGSSFVGTSHVGMSGGRQEIQITPDASTSVVLHEMGHAMGLLHEHDRSDRDSYLIVHGDLSSQPSEFAITGPNDGAPYGSFDFDSVMLYESFASARPVTPPQLLQPVMTTLSGATFQTGAQLSAGDVAALSSIYHLTSDTIGLARPINVDFDGDGLRDYFWHAPSGGNQVWLMNGTHLLGSASLNNTGTSGPGVGWNIAGLADLNRDGRTDIFWHNCSTGQNQIWFMSSGTVIGAASPPSTGPSSPLAGWNVAALADYNGDGRPDVLWHNQSTGENLIWLMDNNGGASGVMGLPNSGPSSPQYGYQVMAAADFNRDGYADVLWHSSSGDSIIWYLSPSGVSDYRGLPATGASTNDRGWNPVAVADFNRDGVPDIFWHNSTTGENLYWPMNRQGPSGAVIQFPNTGSSTSTTGWNVARGTSSLMDYGAIQWHNFSTGQNIVWYLDANGGAAAAGLPNTGDWSVY